MKKSEFTENPAPVELEGTVLRICFDTEEVDQVINNGEEGQESETRKVYLAMSSVFLIRLPWRMSPRHC